MCYIIFGLSTWTVIISIFVSRRNNSHFKAAFLETYGRVSL